MRDSRDGPNNHTAMNTAASGATRHPLQLNNANPTHFSGKAKAQKGASAHSANPFSTLGGNPDAQSASVFPLNQVFYHPHPLNNNLQNGKDVPPGQPGAQGALGDLRNAPAPKDPARPHSQKQAQGPINNRNSRKNLKPLGKKPSQASNQNANMTHKALRAPNMSG